MKFYHKVLFFIIIITLAEGCSYLKIDNKKDSNISAYYNTDGFFAGFIQKKNGLIRACEFSTNGNILSCSKWFDEELLKQGQNQGLNEEDI